MDTPESQGINPNSPEALVLDRLVAALGQINSRAPKNKAPDFPKPATYTGIVENDACENWCLSILRWIKLQERFKRNGEPFDEFEKIQMVGCFLSGTAQTWWRREEKRCDDGDIGALLTLDLFLEGLRSFYSPADNQEVRQRRFETKQQSAGAQAFIRDLQAIARLLEPIPSDMEIARKIRMGLKERVRRQLDINNNTPSNMALNDYIRQAISVDTTLFREAGPEARAQDKAEQKREQRRRRKAPTALTSMEQSEEAEASSSKQSLNAIPKAPKNRSPASGANRAPLGKRNSNQETRDCYNCGKKGHLARDCRSKRAQ